jgi:hypothetical protein
MTRRVPKDPLTKTSYNGAGMASLSIAERKRIGKRESKKLKAKKAGWPSSVEKYDNPSTYHKATVEWACRMSKHEVRYDGKRII